MLVTREVFWEMDLLNLSKMRTQDSCHCQDAAQGGEILIIEAFEDRGITAFTSIRPHRQCFVVEYRIAVGFATR